MGSLRVCVLSVHVTDPPSYLQPLAIVGFPLSLAVYMFPLGTSSWSGKRSFCPWAILPPILLFYSLLTVLLTRFSPLNGLPSIIYSAAGTEPEALTAYKELRHPTLRITLCIFKPCKPRPSH